MTPVHISAGDIASVATWPLVVEALRKGHRAPPADIGDTLIGTDENRMLVRSAWVPGVAAGVKAATVVPANPARGLPSVHAQVLLFDPETGQLRASVEGGAITAWKTAGDSALGCDRLACEDASTLAMIGAGAMAEPLVRAHASVRGISRVAIWNRTRARAEALARRLDGFEVRVADTIEDAVREADIVSCATMTVDPVLKGTWLTPGVHLDLVGAYRADMREADDEALRRARIFVDSFDTTLDHIGELRDPLARGVIEREDVLGDLHALVAGEVGRENDNEITLFKNGGGAHLDVMVADAIVRALHGDG